MTKIEAERLFMEAVTSDKKIRVMMSAKETITFRTLIGRVLKEMYRAQAADYNKARNFTIQREGEYAVIAKADINRYKAEFVEDDGTFTPLATKVDDFGANDIVDDSHPLKAATIDGVNCRTCKNKTCIKRAQFQVECKEVLKVDPWDAMLTVDCDEYE